MVRTGDEPVHARSALRARRALAAFGLVCAIAGVVLFLIADRTGWAVACGVVAVVALIDLLVVIRHIRQGPHFQPGPDVPPYRPGDEPGGGPPPGDGDAGTGR
ncbi:hypothetical protein IHE55_05675 [Streptomyces pactum]|uniref:DUF3040 domain-containing protein n=1 Tax=Streptomyces pactum TaxID=68249 RepID=A0ABS0NGK8_9ACTN|nr:DUF6343 family protein [Streptomyces pactum]MBH5334320.1 hypothetical protein [Streptomyces pactum]